MTPQEVFAVVAGRVPYLAASTTADGPDWVRADEIVAGVATFVPNTMAGFGTDDEAVAASLFTEAYAFRVAGTALAAFALDLPVPDLAPDRVALTLDQPRPAAVAYLDPHVQPRTAAELADALVEAHLQPFVAAVHREFKVGERLLWGNVAAACAVAFRAVESSGADRQRVRDRANDFMTACHTWFDGLGNFTTETAETTENTELTGHQGWFWDRTSCCLWYRTADGRLCDNCSLRERTAGTA